MSEEIEDGAAISDPPERAAVAAPGNGKEYTLLDLYAEKGPPPRDVARDLKRREDYWPFTPELVIEALDRMGVRDNDLKRTRSLVHELAFDRRLGPEAAKFGAHAIRSDVAAALPGWPDLDKAGAEPDPKACLEVIAAHIRTTVRKASAESTDSVARRATNRGRNALMIAVDFLAVTMGLSASDAVPVLREALGGARELAGPRPNPRLVRIRALSDANLGEDRVRALLELLQPWIDELAELRGELQETQVELAGRDREVSELREEKSGLAAQLRRAEQDVHDRSQELAELRDYMKDADISARGDLSDLRGKVISTLDSKILTKLATASEALGADPPRTKVTKLKIDDALDDIEGHLNWLRSLE